MGAQLSFGYDWHVMLISWMDLTICTGVFLIGRRRRPHFALRLATVLLGGLLILTLLAALRAAMLPPVHSDFIDIIYRLTRTVSAVAVTAASVFLLFEETAAELLFCISAGAACQMLVGQLWSLALNLSGFDDQQSDLFGISFGTTLGSDIAYFAVHGALYALVAHIFRRTNTLDTDDLSATIIPIAAALLPIVLGAYSRQYENGSPELRIVLRLFYIVCALLTLWLCTGVSTQSQTRHELEITERLLAHEQHQYEVSKANIDAMNTKVHDLKHRLTGLERQLDADSLAMMHQAIDLYDSSIRTGNPVLDMILYEKKTYCDARGIRVSCMADGTALSFVSSSHLYSLFGNAIQNAVEALEQLDDPDRRLIDIAVCTEPTRTGMQAQIDISNWCPPGSLTVPGTTSKADRNRHGYGLSSIQYVAHVYGGSLETTAIDGIYRLRVTLPIPTA